MRPGLKLAQFGADDVNVDVMPANVKVSFDGARDVIVQVVQSLQQFQFVSYLLQLRVLCQRQTKQALAGRLSLVLNHQRLEHGLEELNAV